MTAYMTIADQLVNGLGLKLPPVAIARMKKPPVGVPNLKKNVPSACAMWRIAENELFFADATSHMECPIGAMVMGFELPEEKGKELMDLVGQMCDICYIKEEEVPHIAHFEDTSGVLYGPLSQFPTDPEIVLVWTTPQQAMLLQETLEQSEWTGNSTGLTFGRPGCAALPAAFSRNQSALSLGCTGMRTFTEITEENVLVTIPYSALNDLGEKLDETLTANTSMKKYYERRKKEVATKNKN